MLKIIKTNTAQALGIEIDNLPPGSSFVKLGGNSLSALSFINACRRDGVILNMETVLTCESLTDLAIYATREDVSQIPEQYPTSTHLLLEANSDFKNDVRSGDATIPNNLSCSATIPIPHMQLSFIQGAQRQPGSNIIHYYETYALRHLFQIKQAWKAVIESEPIFRTKFKLHEANGVMFERNLVVFNWCKVVVKSRTDFDMELAKMGQGSDIETSFKVVMFSPPLPAPQPEQFTIIWRIHHALIDGYSCEIMLNKVRRVLDGSTIRQGPSFLLLAKELEIYRQTQMEKGKSFWRQQHVKYGSGNGILCLPRTVCVEESFPTDIRIVLPRDRLFKFAKSTGITLASLYYAAWALVLSRYIGSDVVTCGVVFSCRDLPLEGIMETVGSMVNTLPLHISIDRTQSTMDYVHYVFRHLAELSTFQWTTPEDGYNRDFDSVFGLQVHLPPTGQFITPVKKPYTRVKTDIPLNICACDDGTVIFSFSKMFRKGDIEGMANMFRAASLSFLDPPQDLGKCLENLLPKKHLQELLTLGNCQSLSTTSESVKDDLVTLFERTVSQFPSTAAIRKATTVLTYKELNEAANLVAIYLRSVIEPRTVVCVHADRSINWIIALYGILKADAVYCPLDSLLPADLRSSYFRETGSRIFLTTLKEQKCLFPAPAPVCISIEEILELESEGPRYRPSKRSKTGPSHPCQRQAQRNAYLCFTSGSSGSPKGVVCTHEGLVAFQSDLKVRLFAQPGRKIAQIMSPAFDGSIHEIFSALSYGATLVLGDPSTPFGHLKHVDSAILTPSLAAILNPLEYKQLKTVYLVGEAVSQKVNDLWAAAKELYNMYGPTESTCGATIKHLQPDKPVTIGTPNSSTRIYILDPAQTLLPRGVIGEIYLAGVQVSRGYIGRPQETARSFTPDIICPKKGGLMYRTGDRGFWNNGGEIVYMGRSDRQIKFRGFRLDLDDLEVRALRTVPASAVAFCRKDEGLAAIFQAPVLDISKIRSLLMKALPPYAVPQHLATIDRLPLTSAGKTDYAAVSKFEFRAEIPTSALQALTYNQSAIASAWKDVLNIPKETIIYPGSNLLDLGGSSIQILLLSHRLAKEFGVQIPLNLLILTNNLSELADEIENICLASRRPLEIRQPLGDLHLSPIECQWWNRYQLTQETSCFNVSFACFLTDAVDQQKLADAWNTVLARHKILSCRYVEETEGNVKREYLSSPPRLKMMGSLDIRHQINIPFRIHEMHPIRVMMTKTELLVVASHIVCDLTTMRLLQNEVASIYKGEGLDSSLISYSHTTSWHTHPSDAALKFWSECLSNPPDPFFSIGNLKLQKSLFTGTSSAFRMPTSIFQTMTKFVVSERISYHQLMLAAVSLVLTYTSDECDIILGAPYLNRVSEEEMKTVGLFLQPLPIRIRYPDTSLPPQFSASSSLDPFLLAVRALSHAALSHPLQWHQLLKHLNLKPEHSNHPLFDVMVTFHELESSPALQISGVTPLYTWSHGAKFKLMVEALAVSQDTLMIRLEYDQSCFNEKEIELFYRLLVLVLEGFSSSNSYADIKGCLRKYPKVDIGFSQGSTEIFFAEPFENL